MKFFSVLFILSSLGEFYFPFFRILGFLPFLLFSLSRLSLPKALWCSTLAGLTVDLFSFSLPLGFFALNYTLTSLTLFRYRKFFSPEKPFSFVLYGTGFSFVSTLFHFLLYAIVLPKLTLSWKSIVTDLICMPFLDGAYLLVWALLPILLYNYLLEPKKVLLYKSRLGKIYNELSRITRG